MLFQAFFDVYEQKSIVNSVDDESTFMLSGSSHGENSVLRVRLRIVKKTHYKYALAHYEYVLVEANMH